MVGHFGIKHVPFGGASRILKIVSYVTPATAALATAADITCATYAIVRVATS